MTSWLSYCRTYPTTAAASEPIFVYPVSGKYAGSNSPLCQSQFGSSGLPDRNTRVSFLPPYRPANRHLWILSALPSTVLQNVTATFASPFAFGGALASVTTPVERLTDDTATASPSTVTVTSPSSMSCASR